MPNLNYLANIVNIFIFKGIYLANNHIQNHKKIKKNMQFDTFEMCFQAYIKIMSRLRLSTHYIVIDIV